MLVHKPPLSTSRMLISQTKSSERSGNKFGLILITRMHIVVPSGSGEVSYTMLGASGVPAMGCLLYNLVKDTTEWDDCMFLARSKNCPKG